MAPSTFPSGSADGLSTGMPSNVIVELSRSDASTYLSHGRGRSIGIPSREGEAARIRPSLRYALLMETPAPSDIAAPPKLRDRSEIPARFKWNLTHIFADWKAWQAAYDELERKIEAYAALQGTLAKGAGELLHAMRLSDEIGQLTYKVWYFASLMYDEDQRDNALNARRQQVQILFAKAGQASAWFNPEMLKIPLATLQTWMAGDAELAVYRFALEDLYRQQEHVL